MCLCIWANICGFQCVRAILRGTIICLASKQIASHIWRSIVVMDYKQLVSHLPDFFRLINSVCARRAYSQHTLCVTPNNNYNFCVLCGKYSHLIYISIANRLDAVERCVMDRVGAFWPHIYSTCDRNCHDRLSRTNCLFTSCVGLYSKAI